MISAFALIPMLVLAGGATDIARHEAYRAQLQDSVDRAVLAAASLTQKRNVENTVEDYLQTLPFAKDVTLKFDHVTSTNERKVTVVATYSMNTSFLPLIGINSLGVNVSATALERRKNIEISLVLDISGSMREGKPPRLDRLRPAAQGFIDRVVTTDTAPYTSVSIVPYAGSVNPGAIVFDFLGTPRQHLYSSCIEFASNDYGVGMIPFAQRAQLAHFTFNHKSSPYSGKNAAGQNYTGLEWSWCPHEETAITYLSNDAAALKAKIASIKMHDGTGTAIAMNWGMMLLEPAAKPLVNVGVSNGYIPGQFANRPAAFNDTDTLKFIVLMTDGEISPQYRPKQYQYPRPCNDATAGPQSDRCSTTTQFAEDAVLKMYAVCDRAKSNGVVVFTIGFEVNGNAQKQMESCASSPSHFYNVAGLDINSAFQSIASAIDKIRLVQ
jgi:Flp pilus assembly protein TadG